MTTSSPPPRGRARRLLPLLLGLGLLAACQGTQAPGIAAEEGAWHVVERSGGTLHRPPGAGPAFPLASGDRVPAASRVSTASGGHLILVRGGDQIVLGPASTLVLPDRQTARALRQESGHLRYRRVGSAVEPVRIETTHLRIEVVRAVVDIAIEADRTRVEVRDGAARVLSPDGRRAVALGPNEAALVRPGGALLVRPGGDQPFAPVPAIVAAPAATRDASQPLRAEVPAVEPPARPDPVIRPAGFRATAAAVAEDGDAAAAPDGSGGEVPAGDPRDAAFEHLSEGLVDGLAPARLEAAIAGARWNAGSR